MSKAPLIVSIPKSECRVDAAHGFKDYTVYVIKVTKGSKEWEVVKRYSEFVVLDLRLRHELKRDLPRLPSKRRFHKRMDPKLINDRMKDLETYLQFVAGLPNASEHPALHLFLEMKPSDEEKLLQKLDVVFDQLKIEEKSKSGLDTLVDMYANQGVTGETIEKVQEEQETIAGRIRTLETTKREILGSIVEPSSKLTLTVGIALYTYDGANAEELSVKEGDVLSILETTTDTSGWWRCESVSGLIGLVPANYVKILEGIEPIKSGGKRVRVLYEYTATHDDDLSLSVGDIIAVEGDGVAVDGWVKGEVLGTGKVGLFPADYVENITEGEGANDREKNQEEKEKEGDVEWQNDMDAASCNLCHRKFTPVHRRHHCRKCGRIFCKGCSSHRAVVKSHSVRVCDMCYNDIDMDSQ